MYAYIQSEPNLYTVGFYDPSGDWHPDSDFASRDKARERVRYLNGARSAVILDDTGFSAFWHQHPTLSWNRAVQLFQKRRTKEITK